MREPDGIEREYIASGNSYTVENLEPGRRYEWAIEVTDDGGKSTLSSYYSFITGNQKPVIKLSQPSRMFLEGVITPLVIEWKLDDPEGEDLDVEVFMNTSEESLGSPVARVETCRDM